MLFIAFVTILFLNSFMIFEYQNLTYGARMMILIIIMIITTKNNNNNIIIVIIIIVIIIIVIIMVINYIYVGHQIHLQNAAVIWGILKYKRKCKK